MPTPEASYQDQPTRQQLDDLDALMQRMLALPVSGAEELAPTPVRTQAVPSPTTFSEQSSARPLIEEEAAGPLVIETFTMYAALEHPPLRSLQEDAGAEPRVLEDFRFDLPPVRRSAATSGPKESVEPVEEEVDTPAPPALLTVGAKVIVAGWLRPLLWCNQAYDGCTMWLGPLGRRLRGDRARGTLGWTGILLLVAAATWVAVEGIGWIW